MPSSGRLQSMARKNAAGCRSIDTMQLALAKNWVKVLNCWNPGDTIIRPPGIPHSVFNFAFFGELHSREHLDALFLTGSGATATLSLLYGGLRCAKTPRAPPN